MKVRWFSVARFNTRSQDTPWAVLSSCKNLGIELILGERLDLSNEPLTNADGKKVIKTTTGHTLEADLLVRFVSDLIFATNADSLEASLHRASSEY